MALWTCGCGAVNDARRPSCEYCNGARVAGEPDAPAKSALNVCARCSGTSPSTTAFHDDGASEDRNVRLCPACWVPALKRRAALDPISDKDRKAWRALIAGGKLPTDDAA